MDLTEISSWIGVLTFGGMVVGGLLKVFTDQIKMKQKVTSNHDRHESTDKIVDELKDGHHEIVRRQDVTESRLTDQKELLNKIDSKIDKLLTRGK